MTAQAFDIAGTNDDNTSPSITVSAGESVRVRFEAKAPSASAFLLITGNGTTTLVPITDDHAWISNGLFDGDEVSISVAGGRCKGILETGA